MCPVSATQNSVLSEHERNMYQEYKTDVENLLKDTLKPLADIEWSIFTELSEGKGLLGIYKHEDPKQHPEYGYPIYYKQILEALRNPETPPSSFEVPAALKQFITEKSETLPKSTTLVLSLGGALKHLEGKADKISEREVLSQASAALTAFQDKWMNEETYAALQSIGERLNKERHSASAPAKRWQMLEEQQQKKRQAPSSALQ